MKKEKILTTVLLLIAVFVFTGFAYAYLAGGISNANRQEATITTGTMNLTFRDGSTVLNATEMTIGTSVTKTFTIENTGTLEGSASMYFKDLINTYMTESMSYRLEYSTSESGTYSVLQVETNVPQSSTASEKLLYGNITVPAGTKLYYKLIITFNNLPDVDQTADVNAVLNTKFTLKANKPVTGGAAAVTLAALGLTEYLNEGTPVFSQPATTNEGIFAAEDNYGTSYYFRGDVTTNNVILDGVQHNIGYKGFPDDYIGDVAWCLDTFHSLVCYSSETTCNENIIDNDGGTPASCEALSEGDISSYMNPEMYGYDEIYLDGEDITSNFVTVLWKIIRINGDGTLRIQSSMPITTDGDGVGEYSAQGVVNSITNTLNDWYIQSGLEDFEQNVSKTTIFCNDLNYYQVDYNVAYDYLVEYEFALRESNPSLMCNPPKQNSSHGQTQLSVDNGLIYPIGLITADEVVMAGLTESGGNTYLNTTEGGLTFTPYNYRNYEISSMIFEMNYYDFGETLGFQTFTDQVSLPYTVYPVINLTADFARTLVWDSSQNAYISS